MTTGLGRISRDLLTILNGPKFKDVLEVGALGCGAQEDRKDGPYPVWRMDTLEVFCGERDMQRLGKVFFKGRRPILFPVWDATRSLWIKQNNWPVTSWGYFPFDSYGPNGFQPRCVLNVLKKFDHLAVPSHFAEKSLNGLPVTVIPHGYDPVKFRPQHRVAGLEMLKLPADTQHVVGVVATNQARKDWGLVAEVCQMLRKEDSTIRFWWHLDSLDRTWNMALLLSEFELVSHVTFTTRASDNGISKCYSACDVTIAPGLGEGFGYPILESIACGTPVVHGRYGAGQEIITVSGGKVITPISFRWEPTSFPVQRPVYRAFDFTKAALQCFPMKGVLTPASIAKTVEHYQWPNLTAAWESWFEKGIEIHRASS